MTEGGPLQLKGINEADIDDNDILLGRGGKTNHHPGNASYLKLIEARQVEYMFLESRTEKTEYAMNFVQKLRKEGIRFLKKDDKDGKKWSDVGDVKMREKVSQNLREHQPKLKKQLAEQKRLEAQKQQQQQQQGGGGMGCGGGMTMPQLTQQSSGQMGGSIGNMGGMGVMSMPSLTQQISGGGGGMPPLNNNNNGNLNCSPMNQRQFVDPQQMMLQMQMQAQQNQLQAQQQFQLLQQQQQQQQRMSSNSSFPNYPNQMMNGGGMNGSMNSMGMQQVLSMGMGGNDPLPFSEITTGPPAMAQWSTTDERERGLLDNFNTHDHRMSSLTALPENIGSSLAQEQEEFAQQERAFSKQQLFADRDHPLQSSDTLPEEDNDDETDLPLTNIAKPSLGQRVATLTDVDVAVAMGESTHSLLDSLHIEQVPEEREGEAELSPKPNMATIGRTADQMTPILNNKAKLIPPFIGMGRNHNDPATVTPTTNSPKTRPNSSSCVLDNDMLAAWANTADDDDDSFANAINNAGDNNAMPKATAFQQQQRSRTTPTGFPDPFRTASPTPPHSNHMYNNLRSVSDGSASGGSRPSALTMSKRATSNVNETPETRGQQLKFQEGPLNDELTASFSSTTTSRSSSSFSSVKKASLGRDQSEKARLLKQQCMPYAYQGGSFSSSGGTTASSTRTGGGSFNGWPTGLPLNNNGGSLSPIPGGHASGGKGAASDVTPKTARVLQDFGKMTLRQAEQNGLSPKPGRNAMMMARTAQTFDDIGKQDPAAAADQIAMELMVKKPAPLMWRNRTSTIEALDLDSLEDDTVLKEEREEKSEGKDGGGAGDAPADGDPNKRRISGRSSINSIAGMWANMPTSEEFETLVADIAGQQVTDLGGMEQGKQAAKAPASLALPNLKA